MTYDADRWDNAAEKQKRHELDLLKAKQRDYGPGNIANCPAGVVTGLIVRMSDKLARLAHLDQAGRLDDTAVLDEAAADTADDIANYGTILAMYLRGEWPGTSRYVP